MSELNTNATEIQLTALDESAKTNALIAYGLMAIGLFTGIFWIIGAIWAMVTSGDAKDTLFEDHYSNIIKTFWWGLALSIIGFILSVIIIGNFILVGIYIWSIYRIIKGVAKITSNKSFYS